MEDFCIKVISLPSEVERKKSIQLQLQKYDFSYEFIDAFDLRELNSRQIEKFYNSINSPINRKLTNGEVGCAQSHIKCYQEIVNSNVNFALILEDDADLSRLDAKTLIYIKERILVERCDVAILGYSKVSPLDENYIYKAEPIKTIFKSNSVKLGTVWKNWTCGTVGYLITHRGASKILSRYYAANGNRISTLADDWGHFAKFAKLHIFHSRPLLVLEKFNDFQSSIENERKMLSINRANFLKPLRILRGKIRNIFMKFI